MFFALSVLDLKLKQDQNSTFVLNETGGVSITASSNLIMFKKQIKLVPVDLQENLMVINRYRKAADIDGELGIPSKFLYKTPYLCEVIITNVSPKDMNFELLY